MTAHPGLFSLLPVPAGIISLLAMLQRMKGSGPPGRKPHPPRSLELSALIPCPEVYYPLGGAGMALMEGGGVTAKLSHWLFGASGWGQAGVWRVSSSTASHVVLGGYDKG